MKFVIIDFSNQSSVLGGRWGTREDVSRMRLQPTLSSTALTD